jgi:hypothetical protein
LLAQIIDGGETDVRRDEVAIDDEVAQDLLE